MEKEKESPQNEKTESETFKSLQNEKTESEKTGTPQNEKTESEYDLMKGLMYGNINYII